MTEQAQRSVTREARWERTKANIKTIGGAVLLALFIRIVLFEAFEIDGPSMEPTLLHGDRVVVAKFMYGLFIPWTNEALINWGSPDVGNVVINGYPQDWIRTLGSRIVKVHVKDFTVDRKSQTFAFKNLGEGDIDWPEVRRALAEIGYSGYVTTEIQGGDLAYLKDVSARVDRFIAGEKPLAVSPSGATGKEAP